MKEKDFEHTLIRWLRFPVVKIPWTVGTIILKPEDQGAGACSVYTDQCDFL